MELVRKSFDELTREELYDLLKARVDVFVVEQNCPYPELDGLDQNSVHLFCRQDGRRLAYLRYYRESEDVMRIGRVLTMRRGQGLGRALLKEALKEIERDKSCACIELDAQTYAVGFYQKEGFEVISGEFLEDGIRMCGCGAALSGRPVRP